MKEIKALIRAHRLDQAADRVTEALARAEFRYSR